MGRAGAPGGLQGGELGLRKNMRIESRGHQRNKRRGGGTVAAFDGLVEIVPHFRGLSGKRRVEEILLGLEVEIDHAGSEAGALGDLMERYVRETVFGDYANRGIHQLLAAFVLRQPCARRSVDCIQHGRIDMMSAKYLFYAIEWLFDKAAAKLDRRFGTVRNVPIVLGFQGVGEDRDKAVLKQPGFVVTGYYGAFAADPDRKDTAAVCLRAG